MKTLLNGTFGSFWLGIFPHYGFIVKFLEDISREQDVLFFLGIRFWRTLSVLSCFPSRWEIISLTQKSIF